MPRPWNRGKYLSSGPGGRPGGLSHLERDLADKSVPTADGAAGLRHDPKLRRGGISVGGAEVRAVESVGGVHTTRAREHLHLLGHVPVKDGRPGVPSRGSFLWLLCPFVEADFLAAFRPELVSDEPERTTPLTQIRRVTDPCQAPGWPEPVAIPAPELDEAPAFEWVGDTLRHTGTVVHGFLRRIAEEGLEQWTPSLVAGRRYAIESSLIALGVPARCSFVGLI